MSLLTEQQIYGLANIVLDMSASHITDDELTDKITLLLDNIAGFEVASSQEVLHVTNQIRSVYYELVKQKSRNSKTY